MRMSSAIKFIGFTAKLHSEMLVIDSRVVIQSGEFRTQLVQFRFGHNVLDSNWPANLRYSSAFLDLYAIGEYFVERSIATVSHSVQMVFRYRVVKVREAF